MDRIANIFSGKAQLPASLQKALDKYPNEVIKKVIVCRAPVQQAIQTLLNITTGGELDRKLKQYDYEDLFHLSMFLETRSGLSMRIEKNERINFVVNPPQEKIECETVSSTVSIPFNQFINNAIKRVGISDFITYRAQDLNCQNFVMNLLKSNGVSSATVEKFVLQDANGLVFDKYPQLAKVMKVITDLGAKVGDIKDAYDQVSETPGFKVAKGIVAPVLGSIIDSTIKKNQGLGTVINATKKGFDFFKRFTSPTSRPQDSTPEPTPEPVPEPVADPV